MRQPDHAHAERSRQSSVILQRHAVLLIDAQRLNVGQDTQTWPSGVSLEKLRTSCKQLQVASKPVDDEPAQQLSFFIVEKRECSYDRRKHSAAINIRNEKSRGADGGCKRQVHNVAVLEIDFNGAACAF